ncbi:Pleckstrin homology-like domain, partial [Globisporangium splendens]
MADAAGATKRVRFRGSRYIEYDAEKAPVVRLAGVGRRALGADAMAASSTSLQSLQLECKARGITWTPDATNATLLSLLQQEYAKEMRAALYALGLAPPASDVDGDASSNELLSLQTQLELAELLVAQTMVENADTDSTVVIPASSTATYDEAITLERVQLTKKELDGRVNEGYVFGRRFFTIEAYVDSLEFEELAEIAQQRGIAIPVIPESETRAIKVVERDLCAKFSATGAGKPLKQLTMRELVVEVHARKLIVKDSRDHKGKKSKKGLLDKLRPVLREEVLAEKIQEKQDELLRVLLRDVLEQEAAQSQREALLRLVQRYLTELQRGDDDQAPQGEKRSDGNVDPENAMEIDAREAVVLKEQLAGELSDKLQQHSGFCKLGYSSIRQGLRQRRRFAYLSSKQRWQVDGTKQAGPGPETEFAVKSTLAFLTEDQFLKIKERFSAPSPTAASKPSTSVASPSADRGGSCVAASVPDGAVAGIEAELEAHLHSGLEAPASKETIPNNGDLPMDTPSSQKAEGAPSDDSTAKQLQQDAKKFYSRELKWPHQTQVERWYVEDNYFKGSLTCWTMDKGAELVRRITNVVATASMTTRINPDISLQWIGRWRWPQSKFVSDTGAKRSDSNSVSTLVADEDDFAPDDGLATPCEQEEGDVVAPLPLSWFTLSTTSLPESVAQSIQSGCGSNGSNDPRDDDTWCAPEKTGWRKKKTGLNSWQQRYFELKGNRLYYFANETDGVPRGATTLDHAHVLRGKGDQSMSFSITTSSASNSLQFTKFSARMTPQVQFHSFASPGKKKEVPFYRLRTTPSSSASSADADDHSQQNGGTASEPHAGISAFGCAPAYYHFGSVKYLADTDPLLWEIHPHGQLAIRKKATLARTKIDYLTILTKYSATFRQIFLPRPRPISLEQTLRDILPELSLINNILYGGGDENSGLENIFEVLDSYIKRFASAQEERVRAVSTLPQACARTISGGDSYLVIHSLLGNPFVIIRPAEARGHSIEIEVSPTNPCQFLITVFSAFSFHHTDDVEKFGDTCDANGGTAMTPEPLLRVKTYHIQKFDFGSGKSSRWFQIRADGMKDDGGADSQYRHTWVIREGSDSGFGALLDALSSQ